MDLVRHLRYFVAVAESEHFGRAAERMAIAQPSLSQRIMRLERELGVRLFDRDARGARLTEAGRLLLPEARAVVGTVEQLHAAAARARAGEVGSLRAAVPPELGSAEVAALVGLFRERSPGVRLALRELATPQQVAELAAGGLDVAVLRHPVDAVALGLGEVLGRPLGVLMPRGAEGSDGSDGAAVDPAALAGLELVLFPRAEAPALHEEVLVFCRRHGFTPAAVVDGRDSAFTAGLVRSGAAVAFAPEGRAVPEGVVWRPLAGEPLWERVSVGWRTGREEEPVVRLFTEVVERVLVEHGGMEPLVRAVPVVRRARVLRPRPASGFPL